MDEFCPRCGMERVGALRFCRGCRFDVDSVTAGEAAPPAGAASAGPAVEAGSAGRRLTRRRVVVGGLAVFLGLAALGSFSKGSSTAPVSAFSPTSPPAVAATQLATDAPSQTVAPTATLESTPATTAEPTFAPTGPTETARVVRVIDGDTIAVDIDGVEHRLRYIGVDTPETVHPSSPVEWMGPQASAANKELVGGRTVVLEKDVSETDRYGRLLRYVWLSEGGSWTLVNLELVRRGFASVSTYPPDVKYVDAYLAAERAARDAGVGLWGPEPAAAPTVAPTPGSTPKPTKKPSSCHPSYSPCLPIVGDLDCPDVRAMGKAPVEVIGPDEYRLDRDNDGVGCE